MPNRLRNIGTLKTQTGRQYRRNAIYPEISTSEDDIYVITTAGDRYDVLALQFYNDPKLWWIIAGANTGFQSSLNIKPGIQLRIPTNKDRIIKDYEELNQSR